jgi:hypothetical protein
LTDGTGPDTKFRAVLLSILEVRSVSQDLLAFVTFRANMEKREPKPDDLVAIYNVYGTSSHFVVFLDEGKTLEDIDEELVPYNVVITNDARQRMRDVLESKAIKREVAKALED